MEMFKEVREEKERKCTKELIKKRIVDLFSNENNFSLVFGMHFK
jgi:hypothetical protein